MPKRRAISTSGEGFPILRAEHEGELILAERSISCAVLEGGIRVLSDRGMSIAFGRDVKGGHTSSDQQSDDPENRGVKLPRFLGAKNLKPFIDADLTAGSNSPIEYIPKEGGRTAFGYKAELLPRYCEVWLKARAAGKLRANQQQSATAAEILVRGLAHVGINALVDEATGYQAVRKHDALMKLLETFVAKELQRWTRTFDSEFYEELFRLRGLTYTGAAAKPSYIGHLTNDLIYARLAPAVLEDLRRKNPIDPAKGRRKQRHHQWLTREHGHPMLQAHIECVKAVMRFSREWREFYFKLNEYRPKINEVAFLRGFDFEDPDQRWMSQPA